MESIANKNTGSKTELLKRAQEFREVGNIQGYLGIMEEIHNMEPNNLNHVIEIIETLIDLNRQNEGLIYIKKGFAIDPENEDLKRLKQFFSDQTDEKKLDYGEKDVEKFREIFQGREGVYAKQFLDRKGRWGYHPVHSHIDNSLISSHFDGDITLGLYFVRVDDTVLVSCIDFDLNKKIMQSDNLEKRKSARKTLQNYLSTVIYKCTDYSIPFLVEDSGNKGYHLWIFFTGGVSAKIVRNMLKSIMSQIESPPEGINYEIFPKQDKVKSGGLGNLVKLPLGVHRKTGKRGLFVDPITLCPLEDQFKPLYDLRRIDETTVREIESSITGKLVKREFDIKMFSESIQQLVSKCPVIEYMVNKSINEHHLNHSERVVLLYTISFIPKEGPLFLHSVISNCFDYDYSITEKHLKSRHKNVMSCPRIRSWLPEITRKVHCSCFFEERSGDYPNPLSASFHKYNDI